MPLYDKPIESEVEVISCDEGGNLFRKFMQKASDYLIPGGNVCIFLSNIGNRNAILCALQNYTYRFIHSAFTPETNLWHWLILAKPKKCVIIIWK